MDFERKVGAYGADYLGEKTTRLVDWYENGGMPYVEEYLTINNLKEK